MLLELGRLSVPPGQRVLLHEISWQEFESILEELGERRTARIAYDNGTLEIVTPLAEHEDDKEIIGDLVKALREGKSVESEESLNFPGIPLVENIPQYLDQSKTAGRNAILRAFRQWVRAEI